MYEKIVNYLDKGIMIYNIFDLMNHNNIEKLEDSPLSFMLSDAKIKPLMIIPREECFISRDNIRISQIKEEFLCINSDNDIVSIPEISVDIKTVYYIHHANSIDTRFTLTEDVLPKFNNDAINIVPNWLYMILKDLKIDLSSIYATYGSVYLYSRVCKLLKIDKFEWKCCYGLRQIQD